MDEIKRRLALIDAEVHRRSLYTQAVEGAPLLFPATGLIIGIVGQETVSSCSHSPQSVVSLWIWTGLLGLCVAAIAVGLTRFAHTWRPSMLAYGALACFACLGAIRLISFNIADPNDVRQMVGDEQVLATVRGQVATEPYIGEPNWCFGRLVFEDPPTRFYMSLNAMKAGQDWIPTVGTILVHVSEPTPNLKAGDSIMVDCWLHRFLPPSNPGQFDVAQHLARINIYVGASVPSRDSITLDRSARPNWLARMRSQMSRMAAQALLGDAHVEDPDAGLVQALLLGSRQDIDLQTYEAFRRTGLLHLVSLSGMNFAMLIGMIWWICRVIGLSRVGRALVGIVATVAFLTVVPPRAPTVRAAIIVWAYCASILVGRRTRMLNSLCLAAIILLLVRPTQLFEAGWQLSFGCLAGIVALTRGSSGFMYDPFLMKFNRSSRPPSRVMLWSRYGSSHLVGLLRVGLAAWIGGAGFLLYHFYTITPLTSLWTVLTFPLVWAISVAGYLQIILAFVLPTISLWLGDLARLLADVFIAVVRIMAAPDINLLLVGHVGLWVPVLYYVLVLFWLFGLTKRTRLKPCICIGLLILLMGHLCLLKWERTHRNDLRMTCLDVGHGQAILVQMPGTQNFLFDAGSLYKSDIGTRIVNPFLDYMGVARLDALLISHGDVDHINGIPEIAGHCRIGRVYAGTALLSDAESKRSVALLIHDLLEKGRRIEPLPEQVNSGPAAIHMLWPVPDLPVAPLSDNDLSAVLLIDFNNLKVLLCSDIESLAQRRIMALYPQLHAQIIVAPHHGSTATEDKGFLPHLGPRIVLCSCGRRDHRTLENPPDTAIPQWFYTSKQGVIFVRVGRNSAATVSCYLNRQNTGE
jgi:competence protein ComEC